MFYGATETNLTVTSRTGSNVTCGVANTKGSYTPLIASSALTAYGVAVRVRGIGASATNTNTLFDLATGAASSEVVQVANLNAGAAENGRTYVVPITIAPSTRIAARGQSAVASKVFELAIWLLQSPLVAFTLPTSMTTFGANTTTSGGTSVTPGSGAYGTWTEIGTLAANLDTWIVGYDQLADTTIVSSGVIVEIGHGPNSGAVTAIGTAGFIQINTEFIYGGLPEVYTKAVLAGDKIWARIASGETEARGIIIYGGTASAPATASFKNFYSGQP